MQYSAGEARTNVLLWTPTHGCTSVGRLARTYLHLPSVDTECSLGELLGGGAMDDIKREYQGNPCLQCDLIMIRLLMFSLLM